MKTLIATAAALIFASSAVVAGSWDDVVNVDLQGAVYFDTVTSSDHSVQPGVGDAYGSILFDEGQGGATGEPQPGHTDNYGSILLDI